MEVEYLPSLKLAMLAQSETTDPATRERAKKELLKRLARRENNKGKRRKRDE